MYPFHRINADSYQFLTNKGITYIVEFSSASFYFHPGCQYCQLIEVMSFYPVGSQKQGFDDEVSETLAGILRERCNKLSVGILFICDSSDQKEICRAKLFELWNQKFNGGSHHYQKAKIEYQDGIAYAGLIVSVSNPDAIDIINEFRQGAQYIASK